MAKKKQGWAEKKGKTEKKQGKMARICPRCKSKNLGIDNTNRLVSAVGMPTVYVCEDCGYKVTFFLEADEKSAKRFVEETKKLVRDAEFDRKSQNITELSYGSFMTRNWYFVFGPVVMAFGALLAIAYFFPGLIFLVGGAAMFALALYARAQAKKSS